MVPIKPGFNKFWRELIVYTNTMPEITTGFIQTNTHRLSSILSYFNVAYQFCTVGLKACGYQIHS